jgi:hypothetical protein
LKPNLVTLRDLRNGVAQEMKYPDYFSLEVAAYGMTSDEMLKNAGRLDGDTASALSAKLFTTWRRQCSAMRLRIAFKVEHATKPVFSQLGIGRSAAYGVRRKP